MVKFSVQSTTADPQLTGCRSAIAIALLQGPNDQLLFGFLDLDEILGRLLGFDKPTLDQLRQGGIIA